MSRFTPQFLDDIRARVSIASVIGRHVSWDRRKTNANRQDFWACCPWHGEKTASFHVEEAKGRYHCFGCKVTGDVFKFLTEKEGISFPEAVERLAVEAGLEIPKSSPEEEIREKQRASLYEVMTMAAAHFQAELFGPRGEKGRAYIEQRGLPGEIVKEFGLGYAPTDRALLRASLADRGIDLERMVEGGLVVAGADIPVPYDRFIDRLIFPIKDVRGRVIGFGGRALNPESPAKYLNSPTTSLFDKKNVLYNLDKARTPAHQKQALVAVEGYMDVIAFHRANMPYVVAPMGTALTEPQLIQLWKAVPEPVLCFDGDGAGQKAAYRAIDLAIPLLRPGYSLRFVLLPKGQDPDEIFKAGGSTALRAAMSAVAPLADLLWRRVLEEYDTSTPERKAAFEAEVFRIVDQIGDASVKNHYRKDMKNRVFEHFSPRKRAAQAANQPVGHESLLSSLAALEGKTKATSLMNAEGCHDDIE